MPVPADSDESALTDPPESGGSAGSDPTDSDPSTRSDASSAGGSAIAESDPPLEAAATSPALEIGNVVARLHKEFIGRGPANTRVTIDGDLVVCLLEGGFTRAEQTLEESERSDIVAAGRRGLQEAMRTALIAGVESTLGRRVRSFMSANDLAENLQVEVFVLDRSDE